MKKIPGGTREDDPKSGGIRGFWWPFNPAALSKQSRNGWWITIGRNTKAGRRSTVAPGFAYHAGLVLRAHGASLDAGLNLQTAQTYLGGGIGIDGPAFMPVLTFSPHTTVWLCWLVIPPALTPLLTFKP
jgi:hypothetical protein